MLKNIINSIFITPQMHTLIYQRKQSREREWEKILNDINELIKKGLNWDHFSNIFTRVWKNKKLDCNK